MYHCALTHKLLYNVDLLCYNIPCNKLIHTMQCSLANSVKKYNS